MLDEAVICPGCGCPAGRFVSTLASPSELVKKLSEKVKINGIIWLVIGIVQIILGLLVNWGFLIVGTLNIISSVQDIGYSKSVLEHPVGIRDRFSRLAGPIITLIYNLLFGGVIGVIGSIYYFAGIRAFVMAHEADFMEIEKLSATSY